MRALARSATASTIVAVFIGALLVPTASAATTTVSPEADSWVVSTSPTANKGTVNPLRVQAGVRISYLRFRVPAFDATTTITSATLRLYSTSASRCTIQVLRAGNDTWGERTITWNLQPGVVGDPLASASWTGQAYRSFVVTSAVTKNAPVSFAVRHAPGCVVSSDATFASREASTNRPQLVLETSVTAPPAACADGLDNDGDHLVDAADPGCTGPSDMDEFNPPPPACSDGLDNDGDTLVDLADPGCADAQDTDETDPPPPPPPPACSDGVDNDGDILVDLADPGCASATDDDETDPPPPPPPACSDTLDNDGDTLVDLADPGCADAQDTDETDPPPPPPPPACSDTLDNDGDTLVDLADPGCADAQDTDETDPPPPPPPPACADGIDNDGDLKVDLADPGCSSSTDDDETDPALPQCNDGLDNDGDMKVDLADPGCSGPADNNETEPSLGPVGAIFSCQATGQFANVDPIVAPGVTSAHPHAFYGARDVSTIESSASLRAKPTTCIETDNHNAFWLPEVREDGVLLKQGTNSSGGGKHALVYYRCIFSSTVCSTMQTLPDEFRFVIGNAAATSPAENPELGDDVIFKCGPGSGTDLPYPPSQCGTGVLTISFRSDPCLQIGAVDAPDHRSHLVDPVKGVCPSGFRPAIRVEQFFHFWVGTGPIGTITLGGNPWWTAHSDYFFGWNRAAFDNFMVTCVNANRDCGTNPNV